MALTTCKDCRAPISRQARACPKCGAPPKRSAGVLGCFLVLFALMTLSVIAGKSTPRTASARPYIYPPSPATQAAHIAIDDIEARPSPEADSAYPFTLVSALASDSVFGGHACGLRADEKGWHKSNFDGMWNATLRRSFGANEVSCLLESQDVSTVERIELEAEFYQPAFMEAEMLMQFSQSAQVLMHPTMPPVEFARAVAGKAEWSDAQWALTRIPYANGGFGLVLRRIER